MLLALAFLWRTLPSSGWLAGSTHASWSVRSSCLQCKVRPEHKKKGNRLRKWEQTGGADVATAKKLTSDISNAASVDGVLSLLAAAEVTRLNEFHLSASIHKVAFLRQTLKEPLSNSIVFQQVMERWQKALESKGVSSRSVSTTLWAIATARTAMPELQALSQGAIISLRDKATSMSSIEAVQSLWAVATLFTYVPETRPTLETEEVCELLASRITDIIDLLNVQQLNNCLWSISRLQEKTHLQESLLPAILNACRKVLSMDRVKHDPTTCDRGLTRLSWSLSVLGCRDMTILEPVAQILTQAAPSLQGGGLLPLIDLVCAYAKLRIYDKRLLDLVAQLPWEFKYFRDWDLCALIWSYQTLGEADDHDKFRAKLARELQKRSLTQEQVEWSQKGYEEWEAFGSQ